MDYKEVLTIPTKNVLAKWGLLFLLMGLLYVVVEVMFRALTGSLVHHLPGIRYGSLAGWTSLWILPVGGFCGLTLGLMNEFDITLKVNMLGQCIIGMFVVTLVEFISGVVLNVGFGLNLWTYTDMPFNILGQICIPFMALWLLFCPAIFWIDDMLRLVLYKEGEYYSILLPYKRLFTLR